MSFHHPPLPISFIDLVTSALLCGQVNAYLPFRTQLQWHCVHKAFSNSFQSKLLCMFLCLCSLSCPLPCYHTALYSFLLWVGKLHVLRFYFHTFSSVAHSCLTLHYPMDHSTSGLPVHHQLPEFTQTHLHWVGDAIQPSHPLSSPSAPAFNLSQHQGLFKWVSSSHQGANVLEFQLQHQSLQCIFSTDFL